MSVWVLCPYSNKVDIGELQSLQEKVHFDWTGRVGIARTSPPEIFTDISEQHIEVGPHLNCAATGYLLLQLLCNSYLPDSSFILGVYKYS